MKNILDIFDKYVKSLDEQFDDCLDITLDYFNALPIIKILYDPTINKNELIKALPHEWTKLEKNKKITIQLIEFTPSSDEYKKTLKILQTPKLVELRKKILDDLHQLH